MPLVELSGIVKSYGALRPLRIERLAVDAGERVAVLGVDQPAAEILVNLITGASLPDSGSVSVLGTLTSRIETGDEWLALVDRFGIVSDRAVLLDGLTVIQNLAMPFSLNIEPPSADLRAQAIALADEVGLPAATHDRAVAELGGAARLRVRIGRAIALGPRVLLLEHPTGQVERSAVAALAQDIAQLTLNRNVAALALTADADFAQAFAPRPLTLDAASGRLSEFRRRWFTRRRE